VGVSVEQALSFQLYIPLGLHIFPGFTTASPKDMFLHGSCSCMGVDCSLKHMVSIVVLLRMVNWDVCSLHVLLDRL
jgi:hypothetical protein